MANPVVARWQDWSGTGIEHLVLRQGPEEVVAEAAILGTTDDGIFAVRYRIVCDPWWRVRKVEIARIGCDRPVELASDGVGNWVDGSSTALPELERATDIDISATPFTNTIPIRRLDLQTGQSGEILAVYIKVPMLSITTDRQRYICLERGRLYRYEAVDGGFTRDIEVDGEGMVVTYPGLFRRLL
jgi:uncharacterized protein